MFLYGCIGIGNMGGAVAQALAAAAGGSHLIVSSRTREKAEAVAARLGCTAGDNREVAAQCQYLFLGVKPQILPGVLEELAPILRCRATPCVLVSMAAGVSLARLQSLAEGCPVVRIMPNTPVSVGAGMVLYAPGDGVTAAQEAQLAAALAHAGPVGPAARTPAGRRQRRGRLRPCLCLPVPGGPGRWRRSLRPAPGKRLPLRSADAPGYRLPASGHGKPSRPAEGRRLLPRWHHHPRRPRPGRAGAAGCRHGCGPGRF